MRRSNATLASLLLAIVISCVAGGQPEQPTRKRVLAVGMSAGWQHESVTDALATIYNLGHETGLWETVIRTDVQLLTKKELGLNAKNLDYFDAVFFMTTGELPMDAEQKSALLSFVHQDGKGFLGAHNATDTFYEWPEYGELIGGYFDGHPWGQFEAPVKVEDRSFPATSHFPPSFTIQDEIYQIRDFSRDRVQVLMSLDTSQVDMQKEGVRYTEIPITWASEYGEGRVFYSGFGHRPEVWEREDIRKMWTEAVKWVTRLPAGE